jgi:hypothetical protein
MGAISVMLSGVCATNSIVLQDIPEAEGDDMTGLYIEEAVEAEDLIYSPEPKVAAIAVSQISHNMQIYHNMQIMERKICLDVHGIGFI